MGNFGVTPKKAILGVKICSFEPIIKPDFGTFFVVFTFKLDVH